ncbi:MULTISPECIES: DUF5134 domain-containing protein [Nocardia]|uniref:DUF5134 domain-containing protein n=1 Tax=Nocardia TaxID=1817 RepID=UPI0013001AD8|nr:MULTISPECIES: DUF5134 domain-containing protein [Nocardia]
MRFVQEYAALRWVVAAAFLVAAAMVTVRMTAPSGVCESEGPRLSPPIPRGVDSGDHAWPYDISVESAIAAVHHESDAAHLVMCLVMLTMLVFPRGADPHALHGVLVAAAVVFTALLATRLVQWRAGTPAVTTHRILALGYHVIAALAMLYAMSGHSGSGPAPLPALALAALFCTDAVAVIAAPHTGRQHFGHATGPAETAPPAAAIPHVVMDLGTAYMLVAAALS